MTTYDFTRHLGEKAAWYRVVLCDRYPAGPDRDARVLLLDHFDEFARLAGQDPSPAVGAAAVQWARVVLVLADAERDAGRSGWRPQWSEAYEHYVPGDDQVFGPLASSLDGAG
ncbi:hypothetical protein ACGFYZ_35460 [Streptomyces sp. NPDC048330]|uniref:hypothetical protein n=1 Tax=Streptomyces sp. NPDC048330 TaxID=3365533 RepID=UPI003717A99A